MEFCTKEQVRKKPTPKPQNFGKPDFLLPGGEIKPKNHQSGAGREAGGKCYDDFALMEMSAGHPSSWRAWPARPTFPSLTKAGQILLSAPGKPFWETSVEMDAGHHLLLTLVGK